MSSDTLAARRRSPLWPRHLRDWSPALLEGRLMPWLKVDDGFSEHPKLVALSNDSARWNLVRIFCYCARHATGGHITFAAIRHLRILSRHVDEYIALGLLDVEPDEELQVHDWAIYNGSSVAEKVAAYMRTHPGAGANEVHRGIGGKREVVLAAYAEYQGSGSQNGSPAVPGNHPEGSPSRAHPLPSRPKNRKGVKDDLQL